MQDSDNKKDPKPLKGRRVFLYFLAFFGLIIAVNAVFIYMALSTQSGLVTQKPYEKGLAYNKVLEKARAQPDLEHEFSFSKGRLRWELPIDHADVKAVMKRPVKDGFDFVVELPHIGGGVYETQPRFPKIGNWSVELEAQWLDKKTNSAKTLQIKRQIIAE